MKILLLGGNGMLGSSIKKELKKKKFNFLSPNSKELDLTKQNQIQSLEIFFVTTQPHTDANLRIQ